MLSGSLKNDISSLKSKLESLSVVLNSTTETEPKNKSNEENQKKKVEDINEKIQNLLKKDQIIKLNIGGKVFKTTNSTIMSNSDSLIAKIVQSTPDLSKEIFFDRSFKHFSTVLDYMRDNKLNLKSFKKWDREEIQDELVYYNLSQVSNKKSEYDIEWDQAQSKSGACTVSTEDSRVLKVHSTGCYTHFLTNKTWTDENFVIEIESNVQQTDSYLYVGIINESYSLTSNCMCCSPSNCYYVQCNGYIKCNSTSNNVPEFNWQSAQQVIGMRVNLPERKLQFYIPDGYESPMYDLSGNNFRVVGGHCNTGNGTMTILTCYEA
jgi:hypothetical protein